MSDDSRARFERAVGELRGQLLWGVIAGAGTGSRVSLELGARRERAEPVKNPTLSAELRRYRGETRLFIESAWRIDAKERVICTWTDSNAPDGPMLAGLSLLVGRRIVGAKTSAPACDLVVRFSGGYRLTIFCDQSAHADQDNYSIDRADVIYIVGAGGRLRLDTRVGA